MLSLRRVTQAFRMLFARLLLYFIAVSLVPILMLSAYYAAIGNRMVIEMLRDQGWISASKALAKIEQAVESYRHKAYLLSSNPLVLKALEEDIPEDRSRNSTKIYEELFKTMKGDTYSASAQVVSSSGRVRYSTHAFPASYDLRYQRNYANPFARFASESDKSASIITTSNRYTNAGNSVVVLNIIRQVRDTAGKELGYVVVDAFQDSFFTINEDFLFSNVILIDAESFLATSLMNPERHGSFALFPELERVTRLKDQEDYRSGNTITLVRAVPNTNLFVAMAIDATPFMRNLNDFFSVVLIVSLFGIGLCFVLAFFFSRSVSRPVSVLAESMGLVESGNLDIRVPESRISEIGKLDRSFNSMVGRIRTLIDLTHEEEEKLRIAERKTLEAQINPHFLYNTLSTIKAIAKLHGEAEILTIASELGSLLRSSIDDYESEVSLEASFALIESYLAIQRIRHGDKLRIERRIDASVLSLRTPKLLVQPLVENAIVHGLEPKLGEWRLLLEARRESGFISIRVEDNGVGFPPEGGLENMAAQEGSGHMGLYNVRRRLQLRYGQRASLSIESRPGEGSVAILRIPEAGT